MQVKHTKIKHVTLSFKIHNHWGFFKNHSVIQNSKKKNINLHFKKNVLTIAP